MNESLINLNIDEIETPIYRVFNFQRFLESFSSGKNILVKPKCWDDPLENFVLHVATKAFMDHPLVSAKDRFYGQCWSTIEESDAMWRIYSPDKSGVKVKTTIRKLLESLNNTRGPANGEKFIGRVEYLADAELKQKLQDRGWLSLEIIDSHSQAASLLFKRLEFQHEEEVRLIYLNHDLSYMDDLFRYSIDPTELFDEIQFDPRISQALFEVFSHYLVEKLRYMKPITRSKLYQVPELEEKSLSI